MTATEAVEGCDACADTVYPDSDFITLCAHHYFVLVHEPKARLKVFRRAGAELLAAISNVPNHVKNARLYEAIADIAPFVFSNNSVCTDANGAEDKP